MEKMASAVRKETISLGGPQFQMEVSEADSGKQNGLRKKNKFRGQAMVEYVLVLTILSMASIALFAQFREAMKNYNQRWIDRAANAQK